MDTLVAARLRPRVGSDTATGARINAERNTITSEGVGCDFSRVFGPEVGSSDFYEKVGRPLARSFVRGYNGAALFLGESGAGRTATLTGRHGEEEGFLNMLIGDVFASLDDDKSFAVHVQCCEIYNGAIRDLLEPESRGLKVTETAEAGAHVRGLSRTQVRSVAEARRAVELSMAARNEDPNVQARSTLMLQLDLEQGTHVSFCRLFVLPGAEALAVDHARAKLHEGLEAGKGMLSFQALVSTLAEGGGHGVDPSVVRSSELAQLVAPCLGGNCQTAVIASLKPHATPTLPLLLGLCNSLRKVKSHPLVNDATTRGLIRKMRADLLASQSEEATSLQHSEEDEEEKIAANVALLELKQENSRLTERLLQLKARCERLEADKADLNVSLLRSEEDRLDIGRALIDLQVEVNRTKEEAEAEALRSGQRIAELSSHCDKLQHELERAGQTQNHLRKKAVEMAQKKEQLDAEYRAQHRGAAQDHADVGAWRTDLVRRLRALVKTTLAVMQERDEYATQLVSQTGLGGSRNAGASELRQLEQEGRALEAKIMESPDAVGVGGSGSGHGGGGRGGGYSGSVDGERLRNELSQELTRTRAQLEALQRENSRQTTSNAAFVQEHRRRLEEHLKTAAWMDEGSTGRSIREWQAHVDTVLKDLALADAQREKELQARIVFLERSEHELQLQLQRVVGSHRALRAQCERAGVQVGEGGKAELALFQESAEVTRLRSALSEVHTQLNEARRAAATTSQAGSGKAESGAVSGATARYLERERATLLAAKATAEERSVRYQKYIAERMGKRK